MKNNIINHNIYEGTMAIRIFFKGNKDRLCVRIMIYYPTGRQIGADRGMCK